MIDCWHGNDNGGYSEPLSKVPGSSDERWVNGVDVEPADFDEKSREMGRQLRKLVIH